MLRHDDNPESAAVPSPAASVRVSPQELADALARLEARQGSLEGTIPLGDAVQELGLNATPEELLREIEAGRARRLAGPSETRLAKAGRAATVAVLGGILLLGGLFAFHSEAPTRPTTPVVSELMPPQPAPIAVPAALLVRQPDHKMVLLSEVGDGQPVLCLIAGTEYGARFTDFAPSSSHWTLIEHGGKVYVRGWIGDMSEKALHSSVVQIHPLPSYVASGLHPVPVTVPVDSFQSPPGQTNDDVISASHVVPDLHFKEKW